MSTFLVLTPPDRCDARLAIAAARAGEIGLLDLSYEHDNDVRHASLAALARGARGKEKNWGVRWDLLQNPARSIDSLADLPATPWHLLVLGGVSNEKQALDEALARGRRVAKHVSLEVYDLAQALAAEQAGFDAVILKGHEAGGRVSSESTFLLLQRIFGRLKIPYYVQGGIGPDTAAAALLAGATGVVLCEQMWLAAESPIPRRERTALAQWDGSETVAIGRDDVWYRFLYRADRKKLQDLIQAVAEERDWQALIRAELAGETAPHESAETNGDSASDGLVPLGQDIGLAHKLAAQHVNVAGILAAFHRRVESDLESAGRQTALGPDGPLAQSHGTKYPILQGPMTRVSDTALFCQRVAENGALPFLALALMQRGEVENLLSETKERLGALPWGVGILGFAPAELRKHQLEAIRAARPPFAIIAGGRPSQAAQLEAQGISTYLHVPSPRLLDAFLREGARKFIFEGRECGGHVGPRSSFSLWQSAIDVLLAADVGAPEELQIVFAGGIHDSLSSAMVATLAAPLVARGMKIGVLMGTGYLFTHEAVECGAITTEYQRQAILCRNTILLESGVGHATRCLGTPFAEEFGSLKRDLVRAGKSPDEIRFELELLNVGRLRVASKGLERTTDPRDQTAKGRLVTVEAAAQYERGMYMIGQLAALRDQPLPMSELHAEASIGGVEKLRKLTGRPLPWRRPARRAKKTREPIAIVGMAGRFPDAPNVRRYWENILSRSSAVREVPADRWRLNDFFCEDRAAADRIYSKWGAFLGDSIFDPIKWRIPPASLSSIDPVQLLALDVAWEAIVDAGYDRREFPKCRTGVVFAVSGSHERGTEYCFRTMLRHYLPLVPGLADETREKIFAEIERSLTGWTEDSFPGFLMNVVAGRISNRLDLGGPNYVIDAACAASLAALDSGVRQLHSGTSDVVLVGAADATNNAFGYMSFAKTHALSPRGRVTPFDQSADGIVLGECVAAMLLKRLSDAERDGDKIYAVIRGIGSSSDGMNRSMTAPHVGGQVAALSRAYEEAGVSPSTVSLVEAHGTGTALGDRTELSALATVFPDDAARRHSVAIGSVKSNIGHTKAAAGLASLVKTTLALHQRVLPPTIGVENPNTQVDFANSAFYINSEARPWIHSATDEPRRAGVSSFGFGGTNFHAVLEEYTGTRPDQAEIDWTPRPAEITTWFAADKDELIASLTRLQTTLAAVPAASIDLAHLAAALFEEQRLRGIRGRTCRLSIVADSIDDLQEKLSRTLELLADHEEFNDPSGLYFSSATPIEPGQVCFLYPGQGSQSLNMLRDLVIGSPWSGSLFDAADRELATRLDSPLTRILYPPPTFDEATRKECESRLNDTRVAQPALGLVELFATDLLARFGLRPGMTGGHSYGEYVALCAAGVLSRSDLLRLSAERGRIAAEASQQAPGTMAAVQASSEEVQRALSELSLEVSLANLNGPKQTIIAGSVAAIERAVVELPKRGLRVRRIPVTAPFHTPLMKKAADHLGWALDQVHLRTPTLPVYSNTLGDRHPADEKAIRDLLIRHLAEPVQFESQVRQMYAAGARVFIEVGPAAVLSSLVDTILNGQPHATLSLDAAGRPGWSQLAHLLARSVVLGLDVQLDAWFESRGLFEDTPAKYVEKLRRETEPKPTDWILGPARVRPVTPLPSAKTEASAPRANGKPAAAAADAELAPAAVLPTAVSPAAEKTISVPVSPSKMPSVNPRPLQPSAKINPSRTASPQRMGPQMSEIEANSDALPPNRNHNGNGSRPLAAEMLPYLQAQLTQWLELQSAQSRVMERMLDLQERFLSAAVEGTLPPRTLPSPTELRAPLLVGSRRLSEPASVGTVAQRSNGKSAVAVPARPPVPIPVQTSAPAPPAVVGPQQETRRKETTSTTSAPHSTGNGVGTNGNGAAGHGTAGNGAASRAPLAEKASTSDGPPTVDDFRRDLLQAVSDRTGYPTDLLNETVPLEAGLGIDSIKIVEIFSNLKQYHAFFRSAGDDGEEALEEFANLKTLRDIIDSYARRRALVAPAADGAASHAGSNGSAETDRTRRLALDAVEAAPAGANGEVAVKKNFRNVTSS